MKYFSFFILASLICGKAYSQVDSTNDVYPVSGFLQTKSFTYRLIVTEYVTNENDYFLGLTYDTSYLIFTRTTDSLHYTMRRSAVEDRYLPVKSKDSFMKMDLELEFLPSGKIKSLGNWKEFRDLLMLGFSNQAKANLITSTQFEEALVLYNDESVVRRMVMEDITYMFGLYGDTFNTDVEYIRLKNIRSPFSGNDYYIKGGLKAERPLGTKNTVLFSAVNMAGSKEKQLLLSEAQNYAQKNMPPGEFASEIKGVGLNSEQVFQYNILQRKMMNITLSDVVSLDRSSRGNIRNYELWDVKE